MGWRDRLLVTDVRRTRVRRACSRRDVIGICKVEQIPFVLAG